MENEFQTVASKSTLVNSSWVVFVSQIKSYILRKIYVGSTLNSFKVGYHDLYTYIMSELCR